MSATAQWVEHDVYPSSEYPDTDGKPMAEDTIQYEWIVKIRENLDTILEDAFVAADLFWYPVEGQPGIVQAPDVLVALGRPKGHRRSYRTWLEGKVIPQVVFEVLSKSNSLAEMNKKLRFYEQYGVEEYYVWDPHRRNLTVYLRDHGSFVALHNPAEFRSPALGVTFTLSGRRLTLTDPQGQPFRSFRQISRALEKQRAASRQARQLARAARASAKAERDRAEEAEAKASQAEAKASQAEAKAAALAAKLRALGLDPDA